MDFNVDIRLEKIAEELGNFGTDDEVCSFISYLMTHVAGTPLFDKIIETVKSFDKE